MGGGVGEPMAGEDERGGPEDEGGGAPSIAVVKATLHDQVAGRVRDLIIEGTLEPGSRIDEARLVPFAPQAPWPAVPCVSPS